jgi:hypothetical protein
MTTTIVSSGQTISGAVASPGATIEVTSGGVAVATTVAPTSLTSSSGAPGPVYVSAGLQVDGGGFATGTIDGSSVVVSGGTTSGTLLSAVASNGIIAAGALLPSELVLSGGRTVGTTIGNGIETIGAGGIAAGVVISGPLGGIVTVGPAGTGTNGSSGTSSANLVPVQFPAQATLLSNYYGSAAVSSGGVLQGASVGAGDVTVYAGGSASGVSATNHSTVVVSGGTLTGSIFGSGTVLVLSRGTMSGITLQPGSLFDDKLQPAASGTTASIDPFTDILTISGGGVAATFQLSGSYPNETIIPFSDGSGGTELVVAPTSGAQIFGPVGDAEAIEGFGVTVAVSASVVYAGPGTGNVLTVAGQARIYTSAGAADRIALGGYSEVDGDGNNTVLAGSGGALILGGAGSDIVVGGGGLTTFSAGTGSNVVFGGAGGLSYSGGSGNDVVVAGSGSAAISGGAGGGTYFGGGHAVISAGTGAAVRVGSDGDKLYSNGGAGDLFGVLGGSVTMDGSRSTGNDVFFGASGTGSLTFITGTGNDLLAMGQGTNTVTLGAGHSVVFGNAKAAATVISAGTGSTDIGLAGAAETIVLQAGSAARTVTLYDYVAGVDKISLAGFVPTAAAQALASQTNGPAGTSLTLADSTTVILLGVTSASASLFS